MVLHVYFWCQLFQVMISFGACSKSVYLVDTKQCVTVPKMLNDTETNTFFRYQIFSIPIPVLFPVPNFTDTGSETFFRYHQKNPCTGTYTVNLLNSKFWRQESAPVPNFSDLVLRLLSGTKFFRYWFRDFFTVPIFSDTGSDTTKKMKNSHSDSMAIF